MVSSQGRPAAERSVQLVLTLESSRLVSAELWDWHILWMCWFSHTSHTHNQMFQHPHFQSGFLLCSMKWLTTYGFSIYACIYLCMYSFICFIVVTHLLLFLTSSKAFLLKRQLLLTLLIRLWMIQQCLLLQRKKCLCNRSSKCNNSLRL